METSYELGPLSVFELVYMGLRLGSYCTCVCLPGLKSMAREVTKKKEREEEHGSNLGRTRLQGCKLPLFGP
jgi:hypothetical protein